MEAGYLSVGNIGQPMSHKLLDGGHSLTVHDITELAMQPLLGRGCPPGLALKELADQ